MLIARDIARAADPVLFALDCGVTPDPWQADVLRRRDRRTLLNCSRQSGKTTTTALKGLHTALYESASLIVLLAPALRQSGEMLRTIKMLHRELDDAVPIVTESVLKLEFKNDSRILALPGGDSDGKTIRGLANVRLLVADEAARIPDDLATAVRPMLAVNPHSEMMALSTPAGRRGWWHDAWHSDEAWHRVSVPASACPRITKEFLAEELKALGPARFSEEYELAFIDSDSSAFSTSIIDAAFDPEVLPLWT